MLTANDQRGRGDVFKFWPQVKAPQKAAWRKGAVECFWGENASVTGHAGLLGIMAARIKRAHDIIITAELFWRIKRASP